MDFDQEELANMTPEEREQLAEELGIPIANLTLKPSTKDRFLITPSSSDARSTLGQLDVSKKTNHNSDRHSMANLFDDNMKLLQPYGGDR